jgi:hypothetical protein
MNGDEVERMHLVPFVPSEFLISGSVAEMTFSLYNPCQDGRNHSSLIIESRDEILLKGGRL